MKKNMIMVLAFTLLAALPARAGDTNEEMVRKVENGLQKEVQIGPAAPMTLAGCMRDRQVPGVAVAVIKDYAIHWAKVYGVCAAGQDGPVTADTLFQVASITKCVGAIVAMRLVQDGVLDLDRNVNDYLKSWKVPDNEFTVVEKVTLRRILSHRAGLTVSGFRGYDAGNPTGLGFFIRNYGAARYFSHDGGNIGFSARFIGHPEQGYGAVFLINSDSSGSMLAELTLAVANAYGWEGIKPLYFKDTAAVVDTVRRGRQEAPDDPENSEGSLNQKGYFLLANDYPDAALAVFRLNLEFNPQSANCSDSLAEAFEGRGDRINALKYYRQALELLERFPEKNKGFERFRDASAEKLRKLESEKEK